MTLAHGIIFLVFFGSIVMHLIYRPRMLARRQSFLVACADTTLAVTGGVAGNAFVQLFS